MAWYRAGYDSNGGASAGEIILSGHQIANLSVSGTAIRDVASLTVATSATNSLLVGSVYTDCGSNEGYLSVYKNNTLVNTIETTSDNTVSFNISLGQLVTNDIIDIKTGWIGTHTASWKVDVFLILCHNSSEYAPLLARNVWDSLTIEQKHTYNLVAVQDTNNGYKRGVLYNGADAIDSYLPNSNLNNIICEAYVDNFNNGETTWGNGTNVVQFANGTPTLDTTENAVSLDVRTNGVLGYVDLGANSTPFTAYVVMKASNPSQYSRLISSVSERSGGNGIMLYGSTINVSSWANDTDTGISSSSNYFVGAIQFASYGSALGAIYGNDIINKPSTTAGRYITLGRTDISSSIENAEPCDVLIKYVGVVDEAESNSIIQNNLTNLYMNFIDTVIMYGKKLDNTSSNTIFTSPIDGSYSIYVILINNEATTYDLDISGYLNNVEQTKIAGYSHEFASSGTDIRNYRIAKYNITMNTGDIFAVTPSSINSYTTLIAYITPLNNYNNLTASLTNADNISTLSDTLSGIVLYGYVNSYNIYNDLQYQICDNEQVTITTPTGPTNYASSYIFYFTEQ